MTEDGRRHVLGALSSVLRPPARGRAAAYAGLYGGLFLTLGIFLPFFPLWLQGRGLTPEQIGLALALPAWLRIVTTPLLARQADRSDQGRRLMLALALGTIAGLVALFWAQSFLAILLLVTLTGVLHQPQLPLGESRALRAAAGGAFDYGRVRLWGSLTFILGTVGGGWLLADSSSERVLWMLAAAATATLLAIAALPRDAAPPQAPAAWSWTQVLRPRFLLFVAAAGLLQGSHAVYYAFAAIDWKAAGLREDSIGWLIAVGVIAEVVLFWYGRALTARLGAMGLLALGGAAGVLRWSLLASVDSLWLLLPVQTLHAFTFGAAHLGAMHHITRTTPAAHAATVQAVYGAATGGLALGGLMFLSGWLYEAVAGQAYLAMTLVFGIGLLLAVALRRGPGDNCAS